LRDKAYLGTRKLLTDAASPMMASMLRDVEAGGPTEADHILGDLVERARSLGVATPLLGLAYLNLQAYAARRRREAAAGAPA
jgi:2-dehydropantoate 2-reductase